MERKIYKKLDYEKCKSIAEIEDFIQIDKVKIEACYTIIENVSLLGRSLFVGGDTFSCNAFEQIEEENVTGAIIFAITVNISGISFEDSIKDIKFALWKNKLLDGARIYFREELSRGNYLSVNFGPGFWGMNVEGLKEMFPYVDLPQMNLSLNEHGSLIPETSCLGMYLTGKRPFKELDNACEFCKGNIGGCQVCLIKSCSGNCKECGRCVDFVESKVEKKSIYVPKDIKRDKYTDGYGLAIDIGSTNIEVALIELKTGNVIDVLAGENPQRIYGTDILTRLSKAPIQKLREETVKAINNIIEVFNLPRNEIRRVVIDGNTVMTQIFLGEEDSSHGKLVKLTGKEGHLIIDEKCEIVVLPNIGGFVGSDITTGLMAVNMDNYQGNSLFVDIGTNGEIALNVDGRFLVCSTAAGPVFEGNGIKMGMSSKEGAINKVNMGLGVKIETIGNVEPKGICGTGILEAIGGMRAMEIINAQGTFNEGINRLRQGEDGKEYVLYYGENKNDIVITQNDIRQIQMAKSAIYAGIMTLLEEAHIEKESVKRIFLAGSFGANINKNMAREIGLLPKNGEIIPRGNTALTGSIMILLNKNLEEKAISLSGNIEHVEIAKEEKFQKKYMENMDFL